MNIIPQYTKSFKVWFNTCDETTCDTDFHYEILDMALNCDKCNFIGSYYLQGEKYKIGLCSVCLMASNTIDKIEVQE